MILENAQKRAETSFLELFENVGSSRGTVSVGARLHMTTFPETLIRECEIIVIDLCSTEGQSLIHIVI